MSRLSDNKDSAQSRADWPPKSPSEHMVFMREAILEAKLGAQEGGIPIGSVLVRGGEIIGRGHNRRVQKGNPTAHAEIDCLTSAGRIGRYRDTILYSTLMPCAMCAGATVQFRVPKLVAGENRTFASSFSYMQEHGVEVIDLDLDECWQMLKEFAGRNRDIWLEDIGEL